jgi:hypothetical protein
MLFQFNVLSTLTCICTYLYLFDVKRKSLTYFHNLKINSLRQNSNVLGLRGNSWSFSLVLQMQKYKLLTVLLKV